MEQFVKIVYRVSVLLVFSLLLNACVVVSDRPLSKEGEQKLDPLLVGTWYFKEKSGVLYYHIGIDPTGSRYEIYQLEVNDRGSKKVKYKKLVAHSTRLGDSNYLNIRAQTVFDKAMNGFVIIKYRFNRDALEISLPATKVLERGIKQGNLKGRIDNKGGGVWINAPVEALRKFFQSHDKEIYREYKKLLRHHF